MSDITREEFASAVATTISSVLGLTRFRGHLTPVVEGVHDAENQEALSARVS